MNAVDQAEVPESAHAGAQEPAEQQAPQLSNNVMSLNLTVDQAAMVLKGLGMLPAVESAEMYVGLRNFANNYFGVSL